MLGKLFKKRIAVTEEELGEVFFHWANSCTKEFIDHTKTTLPEEIDKNNLYNEFLIFNMFLITQFTPQDKIPYGAYEGMYKRYWSIFSEGMEYSQEQLEEVQKYQDEMFHVYLDIMKQHINENYIEKLANYFMYHVSQKKYSSYTTEVFEVSLHMTSAIKYLHDLLKKYKLASW